MIVTCRQIAKTFNIDYLQASSIIKALLACGVAKEDKTLKKAGRGRPTMQYMIPEIVNMNFCTGEVKDANKPTGSCSDTRNN